MAKIGNAAIVWTDPGTGTERALLLDVPLRDLRPGFTRTAYTAESLDKTDVATITVGNGAHEMVGTVRYEDDPQGLMDMVAAGAANTTLTYIPNLTDPDLSYNVLLMAPRSLEAMTMDLDAQRGVGFGEMAVEIRLRQTDETAFTEAYDGNNTLFTYRAGGSLSDVTFARADTAIYISKGYGTVTSAATGKARIEWVDTDSDGIRETPTLLLEGSGTNLVINSVNFGAWTTSGSPVLTSGQTDPAGGTTAYLIADDDGAAQEYITITPTFTTDAVSKAVSIFLRAGTSLAASGSDIQLRDTTAGADRLLANITWSNGVPTVTMTTGTNIGTVRHRDGWYRFLFRTTAVTVANTNALRIVPASTANQQGNIYAYGAQAENALNPSSYMPTAAGTDTRAMDNAVWPLVARPQTMTVYMRYIQMGTLPFASGAAMYWNLGGTATTSRLELRNTGGAGTIFAQLNGVASGTVTPGATNGQVVESVVWLRYTPSTRTATAQVQAAVNGAIGTAGTVSSAAEMLDAWTTLSIRLGGTLTAGTSTILPVTHAHIQRGVLTMEQMRRLAGVTF